MSTSFMMMMFIYWVWIVSIIGGMGLFMHILRLDRPREVKVALQRTIRDE